MSCADDLTLDDITESPQVLERVSAGGGAHTNLWGQIDRDKYVPSIHGLSKMKDQREKRELTHSVTGVNLDNPLSASNVIKEWEGRLDEENYVESGVDDDVRPPLFPTPAPKPGGVTELIKLAHPPYPIYTISSSSSALLTPPAPLPSSPPNDSQTIHKFNTLSRL